MNQYDITLITKENLKGEPAKKEIASLGGKVLNITEPNQRQFAYPVKKESSGYYTSILFEIEPTKVLELNKKLGLNADVLRHLIITHKAAATVAPRPAVPSPEEIVAVKPAETEIIPAKEAQRAEEVVEEKEEVKEEKAKPAEKPVKEEKPKKVVEEPVIRSREAQEAIQKELSAEDRLKALDKKLDELLKE